MLFAVINLFEVKEQCLTHFDCGIGQILFIETIFCPSKTSCRKDSLLVCYLINCFEIFRLNKSFYRSDNIWVWHATITMCQINCIKQYLWVNLVSQKICLPCEKMFCVVRNLLPEICENVELFHQSFAIGLQEYVNVAFVPRGYDGYCHT